MRGLVAGLAAILLTGSVAFAADDVPSLVQDSYRIVAWINSQSHLDLAPLREALKGNDDAMFLPPCDMGDCHAELLVVADSRPVQAIVWASHKSLGFAFWMRYAKGVAGRWRFLMAVPVNVKYFEPEHQLNKIFGRPFFIVVEQGLSGSGISTKLEWWFDLQRLNGSPVFGFQKAGFVSMDCGTCFVHSVSAKATASAHGGVEQIKVEHTATFYADDSQQTSLGSSAALARYTRRRDGNFKFTRTGSTTSESTFDLLFNVNDEGMTREQFLKFDIANLRRIVASPQQDVNRWLVAFLTACKDTPEKSELTKLLK